MTIPLNELSAIYNQSIVEGCGCDEKKEKKVEMLPQGKTPMGGDGARPGKNRKSYVEPMAAEDYEGYEYAGKEGKQHKVSDGMSTKHLNNKEFGEFSRQKLGRNKKKKVNEDKEESKIGGGNLKKLSSKANKRIDADVDGDVDTDDPKSTEMGEFVPSADGKKKIKTMARFEAYSQWRNDLREIVDVADQEEVTSSSPKTDTEASKQIKEKNVKNKIKINPPQGVTEGFEEIGGVVIEMYELTSEGLSVADQMKVSNEYFKKRAARSPEEKESEKKKNALARAKNYASHKRPDPYKARAGESD